MDHEEQQEFQRGSVVCYQSIHKVFHVCITKAQLFQPVETDSKDLIFLMSKEMNLQTQRGKEKCNVMMRISKNGR